MNAAILQRLIWKEYRFLRSFWLSTLLLAVGTCVGACWLGKWFTHRMPIGEDFFFIATVAGCLYSLGVGSMSFATEHELSTVEFLRRLPLNAKHLLVSKVAAAVLSLVGLKLVLWFVASLFWMVTQSPVNVQSVWIIWSRGLLVELEFFAWGAVCSLLSRQPLLTITLSVGLHSLLVHILLPNLLRHAEFWGILRGYERGMLGRAMFAVLLLATLTVLSNKWLQSAEPLSLAPAWWKRFSVRPRVNQNRWLTRKSSATLIGQLVRLSWLQWRQSRGLWAALGIPFVLACVWKWTHLLRNDDLSALLVTSTGLLCVGLGVSVFHGEQVRNRFRFFAERGINPARVWWGHLLLPLAVAVTGYLLVLVPEMLPRLPFGEQPRVFERYVQPVLLSTITGFATAQLMGLLLRNALVAGAATLAALIIQGVWFGIVLGWSFLNVETQLVIGCLGFVPLPLSFLWISRWYASHWILERQSRAVRVRLCAWFLVPWLLASFGMIAFRIWEIPGIGVEPPTREELLTLNDDERQTAAMYQAVCDAIDPPGSDAVTTNHLQDSGGDPIQELHNQIAARDLAIEKRLLESAKLIEDLMTASRRPTGAIAGDPTQQRRTVDLLFRAIVAAERQAGDAKDWPRSLELCSTAMRVLDHWRHSGSCADSMSSRDYERRVLDLLRQRLATVTLTADQYRSVARQVASWDQSFFTSTFPRNCGWSYREAIDRLRSGWLPDESSGWEARRVINESWFRQWLPGETTRADRLLRLEYAIARTDPWRDQSQVIGGQSVVARMNQVTVLRWKTPIVPALIGNVAAHGEWPATTQALVIAPIPARNLILRTWLELQAQKIELGEWPASFDSLETEDRYGELIEYRPQGILGKKASRPLVVQGLIAEQLVLQGDEPCLVYFRTAKTRMPLPDALIAAEAEIDREQAAESGGMMGGGMYSAAWNDRDRKALSLIVELLDPPAKPQ